MTAEPRTQHDYGEREIEAAHRVLIDLGQVLGSYFKDSIVVVGGCGARASSGSSCLGPPALDQELRFPHRPSPIMEGGPRRRERYTHA